MGWWLVVVVGWLWSEVSRWGRVNGEEVVGGEGFSLATPHKSLPSHQTPNSQIQGVWVKFWLTNSPKKKNNNKFLPGEIGT